MKEKEITPTEAIARLDDMQKQIIHGSRTFAEIANVIRKLEHELARTQDAYTNMRTFAMSSGLDVTSYNR